MEYTFHTTGPEVVATFAEQVKGKTFLITGPSANSIGAHTATSLAAAHPAALILLSRTLSKVQPVLNSLAAISPTTTLHFIALDLASQPSVRAAAAAVLNLHLKIDAIVNNAGIMALHDFTKNEHGIEMQFATNHLGHFLLANLLIQGGALGDGGRVVNVSSAGHALGPVRFADINFDSSGARYDEWEAYGQSKCANVLFSRGLAARGITSYSVHPGNVFGTGLADRLVDVRWEEVLARFEEVGFPAPGVKSVEEGTATSLVAVLDPRLRGGRASGEYLDDCGVKASTAFASDGGNAERLWVLSEELVGEKFGF